MHDRTGPLALLAVFGLAAGMVALFLPFALGEGGRDVGDWWLAAALSFAVSGFFLLAWFVYDVRAREPRYAPLWLVAVVFGGMPGMILWLFARPPA